MLLRLKCFTVFGCGFFAISGAEEKTKHSNHTFYRGMDGRDGDGQDANGRDVEGRDVGGREVDGRDVGGRGVNERNVGGGT